MTHSIKLLSTTKNCRQSVATVTVGEVLHGNIDCFTIQCVKYSRTAESWPMVSLEVLLAID